jgi:hypothetical protein
VHPFPLGAGGAAAHHYLALDVLGVHVLELLGASCAQVDDLPLHRASGAHGQAYGRELPFKGRRHLQLDGASPPPVVLEGLGVGVPIAVLPELPDHVPLGLLLAGGPREPASYLVGHDEHVLVYLVVLPDVADERLLGIH